MSQGGYQAYPAYEPGAPYFNGSLEGPPRSFDARTGAQQSAIKQLEPGLQAILDAPHDARHSISSRPFDTYTYPGYEASFHATSSSVDQNLQVLLSGHRPYASSRETSVAYSNPIANFYNDADGPWNSLRAASQARSSASTATVPVSVPNLDYTSYRDAPASEISDSGYASQAAASQSIVNTEPTDYNRECGDLPVQVNSFSFTAASSSSPPYDIRPLPNRNADEADTTSASRSKTGQTSLLCTICGDTARCPSDYKKHRLKHTKPWKCEEPHCSRKDGFTTINDLTRHKKSVHKIGGMTKSFRCVDERCKNKDKLWPRLDNFKQHVTRMHGDRNMEDLIRRSQTFGNLGTAMLGTSRAEPVSQMDCTLAGIDSKSSDLDIAQSNNSPDMALTQDRNEENFDGLAPGLKASFSSAYSEPHVWNQPQLQAYQEETVSFPQTAEDQKQGRKPQPDAPKLRELADAATAASGPSENPSAQNGLNAGLSKGQPPKQLSIQEDSQRGFLAEFSNRIAMSIASGSATESLEKAVLRAILELKDNNNILTATNDHSPPGSKANGSYKSPGRPPPGSSGPDGAELTITTEEVREGLAILSKGIKNSARKSNLMANSKTKRTQYLKCPKCSKLFSRQCDLNKHMKRHDRPYGCTFSKCYKGFGSKNDWKRHEGSQHFHYDMWRCEQLRHATSISSSPLSSTKNPSSTKSAVCKEVFWTGMDFSNHLRDTHCFDIQSITTELRVRLLERGCGLRFWCGFCEAVIPLKRKGSRAADERFNHIDEHFKKGLRTTAWLDVETNKYKGDMELEETKEKNENDSAQDSGEEGSLGEGGNDEGKEDDQGPIMRAAEKAEADVVILTAPRKTGQKRAREESEGEEEAAMGQPRKRRKEETLFFCCGCKQGPFAWSLYQSCLHCEHEFCEHCDRRKHESSAEESVDYNLWNHVTGLGS